MENASKALIIAGGILIGIIVLSIGAFLYLRISQVRAQYSKEKEVSELTKFNTEFTVFDGRTDVRAYEIVSLNNFVKKYNNKPQNTKQKITLKVYKENGTTAITVNDGFIKANSTRIETVDGKQITKIKHFTCTEVNINQGTGRVDSIKFVANTL